MSTSLEHKRHTLAHLLAAAVLLAYPHAKLTLGPAIDDGFYYDIDFGTGEKPNDEALKKIEKQMRKLLPSWKEFTHETVNADEAKARFPGNEYKHELIDEIASRGEAITLYTCGAFTDLCRGGHAEHPSKEIPDDSFVLDKVAGSYWRGDEQKPALTRIYGFAFDTKEELDAYITQREEAKKRDHRKIGKEQGLFVFSELVGAGLPLWTPKGTILREELNDFVWSLRKPRGYKKVTIPHITKKALYETSGHWAKYADDLFRIKTREENEYAMKPMNCPHHAQIFDSEPHSYRDMPQRYAETTMVYRDEQSGELSGLSRVLSITQDDAHVFCRADQVTDEAVAIWEIITTFYGTFGFTLTPRLSRHDPEKKEKYLGTSESWEKAENALKAVMQKMGVADYIDGKGEAAFYGPKIDFMAKDALGRTHQVATIQLDFNQPENFDLTCINEKGEKERIVMIHAAIMGSIERFLAVYIEHTAGIFPLWLAPTQVKVLPISEKHNEYGQKVLNALRTAGLRAEIDEANESLGKKIRNAKTEKVPYIFVVGEKEESAGTVGVETRTGSEGAQPLDVVVSRLAQEYKDRK